MSYRISAHAQGEAERRGIPKEQLDRVLSNPQQIVSGQSGRRVYQSRLDFGDGKILLLRAVVDDRSEPAVVVTVYKTSRIAKYWRVQ